MIVKQVRADFCFLGRPDDNNNYRLKFYPKNIQALHDEMEQIAKQNGTTRKECDWWGSFKEEDNSFAAKASAEFTNRKGETIQNKIPVYDIHARKLEEVPSIANGAILNIEIEPYFCKYKNKKGVMLGLRSVQLIEYKVYAGGNPYSDESGEANPYAVEEPDNAF